LSFLANTFEWGSWGFGKNQSTPLPCVCIYDFMEFIIYIVLWHYLLDINKVTYRRIGSGPQPNHELARQWKAGLDPDSPHQPKRRQSRLDLVTSGRGSTRPGSGFIREL
jgi:hypothetical protein